VASAKGIVAGALRLKSPDGTVIDCQLTQIGTPSLEDWEILPSNAEFVLIVEKDSTFQVLN
jgi:DNA topoisomerase VI subunit A